MDWIPANPDLTAQAITAAADPLASGPVRRPPGRKISHRKNPSDTFAFAAGQLFRSTPEDFYNLLETPVEFKSNAGASAGQQEGSFRQAAAAFVDQQQLLLDHKSASTENLHSQDLGPAAAAAESIAAAAAVAAANNQQHADATGADSAAQQQDAAEAAEAAEQYEYMQEEHEQSQDYEQEYDGQPQRQHGHHRSGSAGGSGGGGQTRTNALDPAQLDPRRAKRILANRQSAQRSRMKRLQYIHDLEKRSATATASLKELQREVDKLQQQQTELAEAVETRKTQVESFTQQLIHEHQMQAALVKALSDLRSHASYIQQQQQRQTQQQQQQQQQWPHSRQHMPNGSSMHPMHQPSQQHHQQQLQYQPPVEVKQESARHPAATGHAFYSHPQQQQQDGYQQQEVYHHHQQQPQGYHTFHGPGGAGTAQTTPPYIPTSEQQQQQYMRHLSPHCGPSDTEAGSAAAAAGASAPDLRQAFRGPTPGIPGANELMYDQQQRQRQIQQLAMQQLQQRSGRTSPHTGTAGLGHHQQQQQAQLPPQHLAVPAGGTLINPGQHRQGSVTAAVLPGVVAGSTIAGTYGCQVPAEVPGVDATGISGRGGGSGVHSQQQQQQQLHGDGSALSRGNSGSVLHRSPSPSQSLGINLDRSLSIGLSGSMSTPVAVDLDGGLDRMLTENAYLDAAGLGLGPSGALQLSRLDSFTLRQDDVVGGQSALEVDLRKTLSM